MSKNNKAQTITQRVNLLSDNNYLTFIKIQSDYNIAQTGGSSIYYHNQQHQARLVSDVNILGSIETKGIIFSNLLSNN